MPFEGQKMWIVRLLRLWENPNAMNGSRSMHRRGALYVLGKILFPHTPRHVRRRKLYSLIFGICVGLVIAGGIALLMIKSGEMVAR